MSSKVSDIAIELDGNESHAQVSEAAGSAVTLLYAQSSSTSEVNCSYLFTLWLSVTSPPSAAMMSSPAATFDTEKS